VLCCAMLRGAELCCAVPSCACSVLCCAVLCCAVLCYAAFYGHVPMHLALAAAFFLSVKHVQHDESLVSTRPEEHLWKTYSKT